MPRIVGHIDMDAFFAAVEELDRPDLRGMPIAVGADPRGGTGRGVVATANYPARIYGIHSAMPISEAWRRSEAAKRRGDPAVVFLRPRFERYAELSRRIVSVLSGLVSFIEEASIDEMYFDLSFAGDYDRAAELCRRIKAEIKVQTNLTGSIGLGPNKMIAKIASDFQKPDGLTVVGEKDAEAFLAPLSVRKIPGIGPKTEAALAREGVKTIQDLRAFSPEELSERFGKWGCALYEKSRGRDDSPIVQEWEPKSIGEQETFQRDTRDPKIITDRVLQMCRDVIQRLLAEGFKSFRTVVVTVRFADFETKSRAHTLPKPADSLKNLESEALRLILPFLDRRENPRLKFIRLVGVRVQKIEK